MALPNRSAATSFRYFVQLWESSNMGMWELFSQEGENVLFREGTERPLGSSNTYLDSRTPPTIITTNLRAF
jgi:hypothetical protein